MKKWFLPLLIMAMLLAPSALAFGADVLTLGAVNVPAVTESTADIFWQSSVPADGQVEYGTTTSLGTVIMETAGLVTNHNIHLIGLAPLTTYYFKVQSTAAGQSAVSMQYTFTTVAQVGATPTALPTYTSITLFSKEIRNAINDKGKLQDAVSATSPDQQLFIYGVPGTIALDKNKDPLANLSAVVDIGPPFPPADSALVGPAYRFEPAGATFNPPLTFSWGYAVQNIPKTSSENSLTIAYYDFNLRQWVEIPTTVDSRTHTLSASISHFTYFAVIAKPAAATVAPSPTPPATVTPTVTPTTPAATTGPLPTQIFPNPTTTPTPTASPSPSPKPTVAPPTVPSVTPIATVPPQTTTAVTPVSQPPTAGFNLTILAVVALAIVVIAALAAVFMVFRMQKKK